jgi:hypothetical protein
VRSRQDNAHAGAARVRPSVAPALPAPASPQLTARRCIEVELILSLSLSRTTAQPQSLARPRRSSVVHFSSRFYPVRLGFSATYFSVRTNQSTVLFSQNEPVSSTFLSERTSQQYSSLRTNQHRPSQTTNSIQLLDPISSHPFSQIARNRRNPHRAPCATVRARRPDSSSSARANSSHHPQSFLLSPRIPLTTLQFESHLELAGISVFSAADNRLLRTPPSTSYYRVSPSSTSYSVSFSSRHWSSCSRHLA